MAEKTIKQKIELTGEKQYNQAVKEATRNLKVLQSQLRAESAELGKNASAQQKDEVKTKSLTQQIQEQEKIVQTLKEALEQAKTEYGDNADVVAKWEMKLNNARTTLGNMRGELASLSGSLGQSGTGFQQVAADAEKGVIATRSFAESLGSIADAGGAISDKIEGIFTGLVGTVRDAISSVWEDVMELAGRANEWADLAGFWNTSAANIQKWYHAVNASHNDFATLNSAVNRIVMADQKKIVESAHVSAEGYADQWEYAMAVLDSLAGMDYEQKLGALGDIFGEKRATGVLDLLNDWESIRKNLDRFDTENGGIGMTEEQMSDMATLAEQVDTIQQTWQAFKDSFLGEHTAKLALDLTGNVQGALDALIGFMDAETEEEREAALQDFTENITAFFTRLGEAISAAAEAMGAAGEEMQGSENGIVKALGDLLVTLRDVMRWFADEGNIDLVVKGFEALAAFWLAGKGLAMAGKIAEVVANIATIQAFKTIPALPTGGTGGTGTGSGGGTGTATGGGTDTVTGGGIGALIGTAKGKLGGLLSQVTPFAMQNGAIVYDWFKNNTEVGRAALRGEGDVGEALQNTVEELKQNAVDWGDTAKGVYENWARYWDQFWNPKSHQKPESHLGEASEIEVNTDGGPLVLAGDMTEEEKALDKWKKAVEAGSGTDTFLEGESVRKTRRSGRVPHYEPEEIVEDILLDQYGWDDAEAAIQDWFDAWREYDQNPTEGNSREFDASMEWLQEVFGDSWGDIYDRMIEKLDETDTEGMTDVPEGWYKDILDSLDFGDMQSITSEDISGLRGLPALIQQAAESGTASGVSGIAVNLDGYRVGQLVAPYVSRELGLMIAR